MRLACSNSPSNERAARSTGPSPECDIGELPLVSEGGRGASMKSASQTPQISGELNDKENLNESTPFRGSPDSP